mgnify:CR=1 FL=1
MYIVLNVYSNMLLKATSLAPPRLDDEDDDGVADDNKDDGEDDRDT